MNTINRLAAKFVTSAALVTLVGTSAFADSRPANETKPDQVIHVQQLRQSTDGYGQANDDQYGNRSNDDRNTDRSTDRNNDRENRGYGNNDRGYNNDRGRGNDDNITNEGRITRIDRERDGYRVQLDRDNSSYFVPELSIRNSPNGWRTSQLRVGVSIRIGGRRDSGGGIVISNVDWLGDEGYGRGRDTIGSRGIDRVRGYVERVDYRRNIVELRDDRTRRIVTVAMQRNDRRRSIGADDLRRGDRVELSGQWLRGGVFEAYRIDQVRDGRRW